MPFTPTLAETRFGVGLSPRVSPPETTAAMLDRLAGPDLVAQRYAIPNSTEVTPSASEYSAAARARREASGTPREEEADKAFKAIRTQAMIRWAEFSTIALARSIETQDGLRERLVRFWADHFTIRAKGGQNLQFVPIYIEEAIRPHVTGRFSDMLKAVITHPRMLIYLDQNRSFGPNSKRAERLGRGGLNENLARELLELHTLGVDGPYTQHDVRELAELLTGLSHDGDRQFDFRGHYAEPGAETVLGQSYGGDKPSLSDIHAVLDDLAAHPATAEHLSRKLARHFIADVPPDDLVMALSATYRETGGALLAMAATLVGHPLSWSVEKQKVKQPYDFVESALRAVDVAPQKLLALDRKEVQRYLHRPLTVMGQSPRGPVGPDGWPEEAEAWVTPQGMAGRIDWAMRLPVVLGPDLPDPRRFVHGALGPEPDEAVVFAAGAAETPAEAIGIVLASPDFQRR
ncbi:DUF1800 domain-containing protein [Aestuariibius sp. 2305UL40-4]|uniref:DUF1800 domain-containing protein n=1 Tax=Aestuariibius violaceus TaxID=3234132 RepID=UPI00345E11D5